MNAEDYLDHLRRQLKSFLPEQQEEILAEIATHLEDGELDEKRDPDPDARREHVLAEMGQPDDMGGGFRVVYRPNRWLDFLLIFIPLYLFYPLLNVFYNWFTGNAIIQNEAGFYAFSLRAVIVLGLVMIMVAVQRRSLVLFAFWTPDVIARLITMMTRESRWRPDLTSFRPAVLETLLAYALLAGLGYWLARTLWKNRANLLIMLFALQPLIGALLGYLTTHYSLEWSVMPNYPVWTIGGFGVQNLLEILSLAGFILLPSRDLRWAALLLGMANYTVMMIYAYWPNMMLVVLWGSYSALLLVLWMFDLRQHGRLAYR
jgi:hypothetical protein